MDSIQDHYTNNHTKKSLNRRQSHFQCRDLLFGAHVRRSCQPGASTFGLEQDTKSGAVMPGGVLSPQLLGCSFKGQLWPLPLIDSKAIALLESPSQPSPGTWRSNMLLWKPHHKSHQKFKHKSNQKFQFNQELTRQPSAVRGVSCLSITDPGDSDIIRSLPGQETGDTRKDGDRRCVDTQCFQLP